MRLHKKTKNTLKRQLVNSEMEFFGYKHGWMLKPNNEKKKLHVRPMTCECAIVFWKLFVSVPISQSHTDSVSLFIFGSFDAFDKIIIDFRYFYRARADTQMPFRWIFLATEYTEISFTQCLCGFFFLSNIYRNSLETKPVIGN